MIQIIKEFIAKLFHIETYREVALELHRENEALNKMIYKAYELGRQAAYKEITEIEELDEIKFKDLINGELANETN